MLSRMTKALASVFFLAVLVVTPLAAQAQCGGGPGGFGGFGGWIGGPSQIGMGVFGPEYQGYSGQSWEELPHGDELDLAPGNFLAQITNLLTPTAHAQCRPRTEPAVLLTATPNTIDEGESSTLTWGAENVTECTGVNFSTGGAISGTLPVSPTDTTVYEITCTSGSASVSDTETVTVISATTPLTASCSVNSAVALIDQEVRWTAAVSGGTAPYMYLWAGTDSLTGTSASVERSYSSGGTKTASVQVTAGVESINVVCSNSVSIEGTTECSDGEDNDGDGQVDGGDGDCSDGNDDSESSADISVELEAVPASVSSGAATILRWDSVGATQCTGGGFSTNGDVANASGVSTGPLYANTNYQIVCTGPKGSANDAVTVLVNNPNADISATPDRLLAGESASLTWTTSEVTSCTVSGTNGFFSGPPSLSGTSVSTGPIVTKSTFTVSCDGGAASDAVEVNVVPAYEEF